MARIKIRIEGTKPLLMNRFGDDEQLAATDGTRSAVNGARKTPHDDAEGRLYRSADPKKKRAVVIPQPNLLRCIIDAGKFHKSGKQKVTTIKSSLLSACVDIDALEIPLEHKQPWSVDARPIRIPATGGRIMRYRPIFFDWALAFEVALDESVVSAKLFREIVDDAGKKIGLGDFRPDCKGPFGKFVVTEWVIER